MRNEPDSGPTADGAVVTYSRLAGRGRLADRQEPILDAREVPYRDTDLRAYDPERAADDRIDEAVDELTEPRRGRNRGKRGGGFGGVVVGAIALAAGMVVLAYAYGIATRVDAPPATAGAPATVPAGDDAMRTTLPADDAARSLPVTGSAPAGALAPAEEEPSTPAVDTTAALPSAEESAARPEPPTPKPAPQQAEREPAVAAPGSDGLPMDGDFAMPAPATGAQPAVVAPVPTTTTPPAAAAPSATATAEPPAVTAPVMPPAAQRVMPPATAKAQPPAVAAAPAAPDDTDSLMTDIEKLLSRDSASGTAPSAGTTVPAGATPIGSDQPVAINDPNALPSLPDPNAAAIAPPADVGLRPPGRLIPPADIPNVAPGGSGMTLR